MSTDPRLEGYLAKLETVLGPFSASDRAEIIMEIKSHVLAALDRDPNASMDSILAALGEPETVANRYLMERGMKPTKPPADESRGKMAGPRLLGNDGDGPLLRFASDFPL
jgi:uncharacterized membrane protein